MSAGRMLAMSSAILVSVLLVACGTGSSSSANPTEVASCKTVRTFVETVMNSHRPVSRTSDPALFDAMSQVANRADNRYVREVAGDLRSGSDFGPYLGNLVTSHCAIVDVPMGSVLLSGSSPRG